MKQTFKKGLKPKTLQDVFNNDPQKILMDPIVREKLDMLFEHVTLPKEERLELEEHFYNEEHLDEVETSEGDYRVLTDGETLEEWEDQIDQYIDDCVLCELPEAYRCYFDSEKFMKDCSYDGYGHTLSPYDGSEEESTINGNLYYLFRTN